MDVIFKNLNIVENVSYTETVNDFIKDVFRNYVDIYIIYQYIRNNNNIINQFISQLQIQLTIYITNKIKLITRINNRIIINEILNIMERIEVLFSHYYNRDNNIYKIYIEIFYKCLIDNYVIIEKYIILPIIESKEEIETYESLISLIKFLDVGLSNTDIEDEQLGNIENIIGHKCKISNTNMKDDLITLEKYKYTVYNKINDKLIYCISDTIKRKMLSSKSLIYTDLIKDFNLIKECFIFEDIIYNILNKTITSRDGLLIRLYKKNSIKYIDNINKLIETIRIEYILKKVLNEIPIIKIIINNDIEYDEYFYELILYEIENKMSNELIECVENIINNIELSLIANNSKYKDEKLLLEIFKKFEILNKMYINWPDIHIKNKIILTINTMLDQDNKLIEYLALSLILIIKKINNDNYIKINNIIETIVEAIKISNKNKIFIEILTKYVIEIYINKNEIIFLYENSKYLKNIIKPFKTNDTIKINKIINQIDINKIYYNELLNVNIRCNKSISYNMDKCKILLLKNTFNRSMYYINIPTEINIYMKIYETFYNIKHNMRIIQWLLLDTVINLEYNNNIISGTLIPMSILLLIDRYNLTLDMLLQKLIIKENIDDTNTNDIIKSYIEILLKNNIIIMTENNYYKLNDINRNINLNKLNKVDICHSEEITYDIENTTDCYIIKFLKINTISGKDIDEIYNYVNNNIKFKIDKVYIKTRLDLLIKKNYLLVDNDIYLYDI
jgi:hypothetical protein